MSENETDPGCWFHGEEPIPDDVLRVCLECGHAWTRMALEQSASALFGRPKSAEEIWSCPLCIHDFV